MESWSYAGEVNGVGILQHCIAIRTYGVDEVQPRNRRRREVNLRGPAEGRKLLKERGSKGSKKFCQRSVLQERRIAVCTRWYQKGKLGWICTLAFMAII